MPLPSAATLLMGLVKFASVVSPAHATAVANYALQFADAEPTSRELNDAIIRILASLAAEIEWAVDAVDKYGAIMMMVPVLPNEPMFADIMEYREDISRQFGNLKMVDGLFVNGEDDNFWPK